MRVMSLWTPCEMSRLMPAVRLPQSPKVGTFFYVAVSPIKIYNGFSDFTDWNIQNVCKVGHDC